MGFGKQAIREQRPALITGLWVLALCAMVELLLLGDHGPWQYLMQRIPLASSHLEHGIARDRLAMRAASNGPRPRVFVVGSSRANAGFRVDLVEPRLRPSVPIYKIAHGGIKGFEMRSAVDELQERDADLAVLYLSEFDIYSPVQIVPHGSFGSLSAVRDLLWSVGAATAWQHREAVRRLLLETALRSYRYRLVLQRGGLDRLRSFPLDGRYPRKGRRTLRWNLVAGDGLQPLAGEQRRQLREEARATLPADLPALQIEVGLDQLGSVAQGRNAEVHRRLLRLAVDRLVASGCRVLIVEPPMHPLALQIIDSELNAEFRGYANSLAEHPAVSFLTVEESGPFVADDFRDLTHLSPPGAAKLTRRVLREIVEVLPPVG